MRRKRFGIRGRVLTGFLILAAMVVVSGALSIHELRQVSCEVRAMMQDSYRSVQYAQGMLDAQDGQSEVLLRYAAGGCGSRAEAAWAFTEMYWAFARARAQARGNITHGGEASRFDSVVLASSEYARAARAMLRMEAPSLGDYVRLIAPAHRRVVRSVQRLLALNQDQLYSASRLIDAFPERSVRPGLIVVVVGVLFALMFVYLISTFYIRPIMRMRNATEGYLRYRDRSPMRISTSDELQDLWLAIERLMERCDETEGRHRGV